MIPYFLKTIFCSGLFVLLYKLLLEKEKMHAFNRFYLLSSLAISFLIPFLDFSFPARPFPLLETAFAPETPATTTLHSAPASIDTSFNYLALLVNTIYAAVTAVLVSRFLLNLYSILRKARVHPNIRQNGYRLILVKENITPHSFLNYIFISVNDYRGGRVEREILLHELAHVKQKHSLDIVFVEFIHTLFWFNPILLVYRKAVALNHEFLADEAVINASADIGAYQTLLLEKAGMKSGSFMTSQLHYSITKKRFVMMTKKRSLAAMLYKQIAVIPVLCSALFFFSSTSDAQEITNPARPGKMEVPFTSEGISAEELAEYNSIVNKVKNERGIPLSNRFSEPEKQRLQDLFLRMSKEQQGKQIVVFIPAPPPLPKSVPTRAQVQAWKNGRIYGVWINGKRVNNTELNKYSNTDFMQVFVSKLGKNTVNYGKHYYQVDLMTADYYTAYYKQIIESNVKYYLGIRMQSKQG